MARQEINRGVLLSVLFSLISMPVLSQSILGKITDEKGEELVGATAMLMNRSDSSLSAFAVSDTKGWFVIQNPYNGDYVLRISFVGFQSFDQLVTVAGEDQTLDPIELSPSLLDEVIVEGERIPIEIKRDTLVYNAEAFKMRPNSTVEDLLRVLPGIDVDADGNIMAEGEQVDQILVNGKEFFGNNPQMATKNLQAEAVEKVEVFDQKSDAAVFSGVEDGEDVKTINLKLKKEWVKGIFGKLLAGGGTGDRFQWEGLVNSYTDQRQVSVLARRNNLNNALDFDALAQFAGGVKNAFGTTSQKLLGSNNSPGILTSGSYGINWNQDFTKWSIKSYYLFSDQQRKTNSFSESTNFQSDSTNVFSREINSNLNFSENHNVRLDVKRIFNQGHDIEIENTLTLRENVGEQDGNSLNILDVDSTRTFNENTSSGSVLSLRSALVHRLRLGKPGRTLVSQIQLNYNSNDRSLLLNSSSNLGSFDTNQFQDWDDSERRLMFSSRYTEPLSTNSYFQGRFTRRVNNQVNETNFFDLNNGGLTIDSLSNRFQNELVRNWLGGSYTYVDTKLKLTLGSYYLFASQNLDFVIADNETQRDFYRTLPYLSTNYQFSSSARIRLDFNSSLTIPSREQLQPVINNLNPRNTRTGNPNLKAQENYRFSVWFHLFDQYTSKFFGAGFRFFQNRNFITNDVNFDENNLILSQPVNAGISNMINPDINFGGRIRFAKLRYSLGWSPSYRSANAVINGERFPSETLQTTSSFRLSNARKQYIDWNLRYRIVLGQTRSEENAQANQDYQNMQLDAKITWYFAKRWSFNSDLSYTQYSNEQFSDGADVALLQASMRRTIFKNERGELALTAFDILDQNQRVDRFVNFTSISEQRTQAIGPYYMITFQYNLSGKGRN